MKNFNLIDENTLNKVKEYCLLNKEEEACGFIYKNSANILNIYKCKNISSEPKKFFLINDSDYDRCSYKGNIVCCFHSHLNNKIFSADDILNSLESKTPYLLYDVQNDEFNFFDSIHYSYYSKYINLPYIAGVNDCWSTIQKFLNNETNLKATEPDPSRLDKPDQILSWDWADRKEWIESMNATKVSPKPKSIDELKIYDVLILKSKYEKIPTFGGLLLEDNLILHQNDHQVSKIEGLRKGHFNLVNYVGRFNQ